MKTLTKIIFSLACLGLLASCSGSSSDGDSGGASFTISGALVSGTANSKPADIYSKLKSLFSFPKTLALEDYSIRCVTLSGDPKAGTGAVGADGTFSLTIDASANIPLGCFVLITATSSVVATIQFETAQESLDGSSTTRTGSYTPSTGTTGLTFGTITLDVDKGMAIVVETNISETGGTDSFTGIWGASITGTWNLVCVAGESYTSCDGEEGPPSSIYLHQFETLDDAGTTRYGLSIWDNLSGYTDCGSGEALTCPSGWDCSGDASVTTSFSFTSLTTLMGSVPAYTWNDGSNDVTTCGFIATPGTTKCSDITANTDGWQNGVPITYSADDCKAMCLGNGIWNYNGGTCKPRLIINRSLESTITSSGNLACGADSCGTGSGANYIIRDENPEDRFIVGELVIKGATGSVSTDTTRTESMCTFTNNNYTSCTEVNCTVTEKVSMSIIKSSDTTAIIDVKIESAADSGNPSGCTDTSLYGNEWFREMIANSPEFYLINATKQ